jgi:activator of HSP90 ATPase
LDTIHLTEKFNVSADAVYKAWLDSDSHTDMTGGEAECSDEIGDTYSTWDEYITGKNISLIPYSEIIQTWRTSEFADTDPDSKLTLLLKNTESGCELTLIHENIPEGQSDYKKGWIEHYLNPMKEFFNELSI